jgi:hypothetical protein
MGKTFTQRNLFIEAERAKLRQLREDIRASAERKEQQRKARLNAELMEFRNAQEWGGMAVELASHAKRRGY